MSNAEKLQKAMSEAVTRYERLPQWARVESKPTTVAANRSVRPTGTTTAKK